MGLTKTRMSALLAAGVVAIGLMFPLTSCVEVGCMCGASPADPFSEHDLAFEGSHFVDAECVCRCGAGGDRFALPKDTNCAQVEAPCVDAEGRETRLECE
ncbi:MAG: hypothetical protein ACI9KE_005234 [Polyangiales bacterium]|jgi:hypothetical protein